MATFGETGSGTTDQIVNNGYIWGRWFTAPTNGTITSMGAWLRFSNVGSKAKMAVYNKDTLALVASSAEQVLPEDLTDMTFSKTGGDGVIVSGTEYWIVVWVGIQNAMARKSADVALSSMGDTETYNGWPDPLNVQWTDAITFSFYATYTPAPIAGNMAARMTAGEFI